MSDCGQRVARCAYEVDADCADVRVCEVVVLRAGMQAVRHMRRSKRRDTSGQMSHRETQQQAGLADAGVANQHQLEQEITAGGSQKPQPDQLTVDRVKRNDDMLETGTPRHRHSVRTSRVSSQSATWS